MEFRQLRQFIAVAEELHFARAAERLRMEQSPLSQSIRKLEAELGVELFQRTTRRTWLTRAGCRFLHDAKRIIREVDAATASVRHSQRESPSLVRLALGDDLASDPFTRLLFELEHREPCIELEIREFTHAEAVRLLRSRGADVVITLNPRPEPELIQVCAWHEPLMLIAPIGHPLVERGAVALQDLAKETLALPSADACPGLLAQIEDLLVRHDVRAVQRQEIRHWNTAVSFATTGRAVALCPVTMLHGATSVAIVPIQENDAQMTTWLLYRDEEVSPAVSLVLELAAGVASEPLLNFPPTAVA